MSEYYHPIYQSLPLDISRLLVMYVISSGTPNNLRSPKHITHNTNRHRTLSVRTYGFENYVDMIETHLWSITNNGTWMLILVPTYFMKIFIDQTAMTTYIIPFVIGMLLARDSIVSISIPSSNSLPASLFTRSVIHHPATNSLVTMLARLIVMCITEWAQRYLSDNRSDKS